MSTQLKEKINISVDNIETLTDVDLADLCNCLLYTSDAADE